METYLSPECFELVLFFVKRVLVFFLRVVKITRRGENVFSPSSSFVWDQFIKVDKHFKS